MSSDHHAGTPDDAMASLRMRLSRQRLGTVYALYDADGSMRYIGQTRGPAHLRFVGHQGKGNGRWLAVRVLERVPLALLFLAEERWIAWATERGADLVNVRKMAS